MAWRLAAHPFPPFASQIWSYNGLLMHQLERKELYQASWRPAADGVYPDRKQSKKRERQVEEVAKVRRWPGGGGRRRAAGR